LVADLNCRPERRTRVHRIKGKRSQLPKAGRSLFRLGEQIARGKPSKNLAIITRRVIMIRDPKFSVRGHGQGIRGPEATSPARQLMGRHAAETQATRCGDKAGRTAGATWQSSGGP
jgi:hypothetical protein